MVTAERDALANRRWQPNDGDDLRAAIVHRTRSIYELAVVERPDWVIELLTELDDRGTLQQLRPGQLHQLIVAAGVQRDMGAEPQARPAR